jgi:hypothetical protein
MKWTSHSAQSVALLTCVPLAFGFPHGHDFLFEVPRIAEYRNALAAGQWPPFWAENLYGGFGSPIFLFYAPLFMFVAATSSLPFDSVLIGASLAVVAFTLLSAWLVMGMVRCALEGTDGHTEAAARVAGWLYVLSPYLIGDKLLRSANAEFTALCVAPLALWGLFLIRSNPWRGTLYLALGVFLTLIAHNLTALVLLVALAVATLALYFPIGRWQPFLHACGGVFAGMAASAFLWLPALAYKADIQTEGLTTGRLDFHQLFAPLERLFSYAGYSVGWLPVTLLALAALVATQKSLDPRLRRLLGGVMLMSAAFIFLQTRASLWLWEHLPWLPLFQFPWRMMGPLALLTAIAGAVLFFLASRRWPRFRHPAVEVGILLVCVANAVPQFLRYETVERERAQQVQPGLTPEAIRASPFTTTVYDEYLPRGGSATLWRQARADQGPVLGSDHPARWEVRPAPPGDVEIVVTAERATTIHLARWHFPVWELTIDGRTATPSASRWRTVDVPVPAGTSVVSLRLISPPVRIVGLWITLFGIALCGALAVLVVRTSLPRSGVGAAAPA